MIEKMKKVTVLAEGSRKQELLLSLREEGVMHISDLVMKTQRLDEMEKERGEYVRIRQMLIERGDKKDKRKLVVEGKDFERLHQAILKDTEDEERLKKMNVIESEGLGISIPMLSEGLLMMESFFISIR